MLVQYLWKYLEESSLSILGYELMTGTRKTMLVW